MCSSALKVAIEVLQKFRSAFSPLHKVQYLQQWSVVLQANMKHLYENEIDPDLLAFLRAWTFAKAEIPNPSSQLRFLRDYLLPSNLPESLEFEAAEHVRILETTLETIRAIRNTKEWLVVKVENGIVANMRSAPSSALSFLIAILDRFQKTVSPTRRVFTFPGTNFVPLIDWFARDWDLLLTEDLDRNMTIVTVLNPENFPLSPDVCEAIMLRLSRFER